MRRLVGIIKMELPINYDKASSQERKAAREEYVKLQKGLCIHCGQELSKEPFKEMPIKRRLFPPNFFKWPVHLHHDHKTGMTLGAIHSYCNALLWQYHGE